MNKIQNVSCLGHNFRDAGLLSKILKRDEKRATKKQLHHTDSSRHCRADLCAAEENCRGQGMVGYVVRQLLIPVHRLNDLAQGGECNNLWRGDGGERHKER